MPLDKSKRVGRFGLYINKYIMFTLRKITSGGLEHNFALGRTYTPIFHDRNPVEFKELALRLFKEESPENTYGFIVGDFGEPHCLYRKQANYIVSESGKTFANVSE